MLSCTYIHGLHQHLISGIQFVIPFLVAIDVFPCFTSSGTQVCRPLTHRGAILEVKLVHPMDIFATHVNNPIGNSTDSTELRARHHSQWMECYKVNYTDDVVNNNARGYSHEKKTGYAEVFQEEAVHLFK